jgi:hypothetical protein
MNITDIAIPIFVSTIDDGKLNIIGVQGTAFSIGNGFFLTAKHVMEQIIPLGNRRVSLGFKIEGTGEYEFCHLTAWDCDDSSKLDVCLLCAEKEFPAIKWKSERIFNLTPVLALGYPFGFDPKHRKLYNRSFKGYVVSSGTHADEGLLKYELSFSCPRGISGAALLTEDYSNICGLIIGNSLIEIEIGSQIEVIEEEAKKVYTKMETTTFGIAYHVSEMLAMKFESLGSVSLQEYLKTNSLLV